MDISYIACPSKANTSAITYAEHIQEVLEAVKKRLTSTYSKEKARVDAYRKLKIFQPGELVMVHFRKERMPVHMGGKLEPRKYGPYKFLHWISDNAYVVDLPDEYGVSKSFNMANLTPFFDAFPLPSKLAARDKLISKEGRMT